MQAQTMKTILLVEDEGLLALSEKRHLEESGYAVLVARSGEAAIEAAASPEVDLVLMDIDLGAGPDGTEAAEAILKCRDLPIVFLSSHAEPEVVERTERIASYGFVVKSTSYAVLDASIKMAFKLHEARRLVVDSEARHAWAEGIARIGNWRIDLASGTIHGSPGALLVYGLVGESFPLKAVQGLVLPEYRARGDEALRALIAEGRPYEFEARIRRQSDGAIVDIHSIAEYDPVARRVNGVVQDVTERRRAEARIRESEEKLRSVIAATQAGSWELEVPTGKVILDEVSAGFLGATADEFRDFGLGDWMALKHPEDRERSSALMVDHLEGRLENYSSESRMRHRDGHWVWILGRGKVVERDSQGRPLRMFGIHLDITEQRRVQEEVSRLLEEKSLILKEVQHRIKNNMSTMVSLLSLQADVITDPQASRVILDAENRLRSMGVLYEKLYCAENLQAMSARDYLPDLVREIVDDFPTTARVEVACEVDDCLLSIKELSTLGILVNEVITNSLKYAFQGRPGGRITLEVREAGGILSLRLADDGVGLPGEVDIRNPTNFGLTLVGALAAQLGAEIGFSSEGGTAVSLSYHRPALQAVKVAP